MFITCMTYEKRGEIINRSDRILGCNENAWGGGNESNGNAIMQSGRRTAGSRRSRKDVNIETALWISTHRCYVRPGGTRGNGLFLRWLSSRCWRNVRGRCQRFVLGPARSLESSPTFVLASWEGVRPDPPSPPPLRGSPTLKKRLILANRVEEERATVHNHRTCV